MRAKGYLVLNTRPPGVIALAGRARMARGASGAGTPAPRGDSVLTVLVGEGMTRWGQ